MSDKPIKINLMLPRSLWKALAIAAATAAKSRAEFVRVTLAAACEGKSAKGYPLAQVALEPKRAQPTAPALPPREQWGAIRVCVKCFAISPQTWENCVECGAVLPPPLPDELEVEEEHEPIVYEPDVYYAHWLKVGRTKEDAYNMVKMACRDEGIDWEPRVEEVDSASGPQ